MRVIESTRMSMGIERYTGKEYLALHQAKYGGHALTSDSLNKILKNQKNIYTRRFNKLNNSKMSFKQINSLMNEWVSQNGVIGEKVYQAMQDLLLFDNNGQTSKVSTSGGVQIGDITLSTVRSNFNTSKKRALESISSVCNGVDNAVNTMIGTIADCNESLLVQEAIAAYYENNQNIPPDLAKRMPKNTTINTIDIDKSNSKIPKLIQTIKSEKDKLQQLGKTARSYNAKDFRANYSEIIGAIGAAFNSLGGVVFETAQAYSINEANRRMQEEIKNSNQEIASKLAAHGHSWTAIATGQDTDEDTGQETKNDVTISWDRDGISFNFGGSIKLRQSVDFRGHGGPGSEALPIKGFIARSETLGSLLKKVNRYSPGIVKYAESSLAAIRDSSPFESWEIMKQCVGALTFVDAMAGLGEEGDFSTLLIVNNRIFSIGDILNNVYNAQDALLTKGARKPYLVEGMALSSLRRQLQKTIEEKAAIKPKRTATYTEAVWRNAESRRLINDTKISITLNLGNIYGKNIFK